MSETLLGVLRVMSTHVPRAAALHPRGASEPEDSLGSQRGCGLLEAAGRGLSQGSRQPGSAGGHRLVFPCDSAGEESACNEEDRGSVPGLGRSPGGGHGNPLQYSWASFVAQLVKNPPAMWDTWFDPWVGKVPWRKQRLPTPVFWPGEFHGLSSPWGCRELDTTERLSCHFPGLFRLLAERPQEDP